MRDLYLPSMWERTTEILYERSSASHSIRGIRKKSISGKGNEQKIFSRCSKTAILLTKKKGRYGSKLPNMEMMRIGWLSAVTERQVIFFPILRITPKRWGEGMTRRLM